MKILQSVPKRRHINFRRPGITQKEAKKCTPLFVTVFSKGMFSDFPMVPSKQRDCYGPPRYFCMLHSLLSHCSSLTIIPIRHLTQSKFRLLPKFRISHFESNVSIKRAFPSDKFPENHDSSWIWIHFLWTFRLVNEDRALGNWFTKSEVWNIPRFLCLACFKDLEILL
jgi:hypothetical protein